MDAWAEVPQVVEGPAPWAWPEGAARCFARMTVSAGRVESLTASCDAALDPELERLRALRFEVDDRLFLVFAHLKPPKEGDLAVTRLGAPMVSPDDWDPAPVRGDLVVGTRCGAEVAFGPVRAKVIPDPDCPADMARAVVRAASTASWHIEGSLPAKGAVVHARFMFQVAADGAHPGRRALHVEFPSALARDHLRPMLPPGHLLARISVDAEGNTTGIVVEEGTPEARRKFEEVAATWTWWPAYRDGVAVPDDQPVEFTR